MFGKILTVIVPSYNMEKYLPKCLGSLIVASDLMEKLEVLVVNDGSEDRTSEIAHKFESKYPQTFKVIDKTNGNYGSCINAALPKVTGFYVKVLDAGDYVETEPFAKSMRVLLREAERGEASVDMLIADYDRVDERGVAASRSDFGLGTEGRKSLSDVLESTPRFEVHAIIYKTDNLRRINYHQTEGVSYTDTEWFIEPMVTVRWFYYLPQVVTHYLVGRTGQTMEPSTFAKNFQQVVEVAQNILSRYDSLMSIAETESLGYYQTQVRGMIRMIYGLGIWGWKGIGVTCNLSDWDLHLAKTAELYDFASRICVKSRFFKFNYVDEWRRKKSRKTIRFFLFDGYAALLGIKDWIIKTWRLKLHVALPRMAVV